MTPGTHSQKQQFAEQVENLEALMRGWGRGSRSTRLNSNYEESRMQSRDENTQTRVDQMVDVINQASAEWDREHTKSRLSTSKKPRRAKENSVSKRDVHNTVETLMPEANNQLDDRVKNIAD